MGCNCGSIKNVNAGFFGGVSVCAVSYQDLNDLISMSEYILSVKNISFIRKQLDILQKMSDLYAETCPDEYNFNRIKSIVENEYFKLH